MTDFASRALTNTFVARSAGHRRLADQATGRLWEHDTAVSYESGSNTAAWGGAETVPAPAGAGVPPAWLDLTFGSGFPEPPDAYALFLHRVVEAVAADPG